MENDWLKHELERRGHGAHRLLALFMGISPAGMSKRVNSMQAIPDHEVDKIRQWLDQVPAPAAAAGTAGPPARATLASAAQAGAAQALIPMARTTARPDLPVWAAAQGGDEGAMVITTSPIEWIVRPRELEVRDAFAVFLIGDSMYPRYDHGDQLYINPHRPPRGGDDCLFIQQRDETSFLALAKTLLRATADKWRVKQFNPGKEFDLDRRSWSKAWKIVGKMNRG